LCIFLEERRVSAQAEVLVPVVGASSAATALAYAQVELESPLGSGNDSAYSAAQALWKRGDS
jgi:hypothetical protein